MIDTPLSESEARLLSPLVLAYVGDAVYELYVRTLLARRGGPPSQLHARCVKWVSAAGQERVWFALTEELEEAEAAVARRGRNAKGALPGRVDAAAYRRSTSLEALVGYLYLSGQQERMVSLLERAFDRVDLEQKKSEGS